MARGVVAKRNISRSGNTRRGAIGKRGNQTPRVIAVGCRRSARVSHHISRVIHIVTEGGCALLGRCSRLQSCMAVIPESAQLSGLITLCDLVTRVVSVTGSRIHTAIPIQLFHGRQPSKSILREAALPPMFVLGGGNFAAGAATAAVGYKFRGAVCIRGLLVSAFPVISLLRDSP